MNSDYIPVKQFVEKLETFSLDFYKKCILETNQFSTKYVLQNVIKAHRQHSQKIKSEATAFGDDRVNGRHLKGIMQDFVSNKVDTGFELENLNFVEATHLSIILTEYVIGIYSKLLECRLSEPSFKTLNIIINLKKNYLRDLQEEYENLRYK